MSDNKKENSSSAKIAAAIGTVILAVLTAQNAPWWVSKLESIFGSTNKPSTPESSPKPTTSVPDTSTPIAISTPTSTPTTVPLQPPAPLSPPTQTQTLPSPVAERWRFMGVSTKTGEELYVDNSSITNSSGTIRFTYKIGNDLINARADCDANRWYAKNKNTGEDYGWILPQSQASQSMMNYVCK